MPNPFGSPNIQADVSSYGAPAQAPNPFGVMQNFAQMQGLMQRNALMQQEFKAKQALGGIIQSTINPETGEPDWNKALIQVYANPETAPLATQFAAQLKQNRLVDFQALQAQAEAGLARAKLTRGALAPAAQVIKQNGGTFPRGPDGELDLSSLSDGIHTALATDPDMADLALDFLTKAKLAGPNAGQGVMNALQATVAAADGMDALNKDFEFERWNPVTKKMEKVKGQLNPVTGQFTPIAPPGDENIQPLAETPQEPQETGTPGGGTMKPMPPKPEELPSGTSFAQAPEGASASPWLPQGASTYETKRSEDAAKYGDKLGNEIQAGVMQNKLIGEANEILERGVETGAFTGNLINLSLAFKRAGADDKVVDDIAGGSLTDALTLRKLLFQLGVTQFIELAKAGQGKVGQAETLLALEKGVPNEQMTPEAIKSLLILQKDILGMKRLEAEGWNAHFNKEGRSLDEWQFERWPKLAEAYNKIQKKRLERKK